jgi:hypothetical protein
VSASEKSRLSYLKITMCDSKEDGPETVVMIKGFSGPAESRYFVDAMFAHGILKPPPEKTN